LTTLTTTNRSHAEGAHVDAPLREALIAFLSRWNISDWLTAALMAILILLLPAALEEARWLERSGIVWSAAIWGALIGVLAGRIYRRMWIALPMIALTGALFISLGESRALPPLRPAAQEIGAVAGWGASEVGGSIQAWWVDTNRRLNDEKPLPGRIPMPAPLTPELNAARDRLMLYAVNLQLEWPPPLRHGFWDRGQLLLGSILGLLVWIAAGISVWAAAQRRAALIIFSPAAALLIANTALSNAGWGALIIGIALSLLVCAGSTLRGILDRWSSKYLYDWLPQEWWMLSVVAIAVPVMVMLIALGMTSPEFRDWFNDTLNPPRNPNRTAARIPASEHRGPPPGVMPQSKLLGTDARLTQEPAMLIRTPDSPPGDFYWRATSYDKYTGHGWLRTPGNLPPGVGSFNLWPATTDPPPGSALLRQDIQLAFDTRQVYAAGRPIRLNMRATGLWSDPAGSDLISVTGETSQRAYQVLSWVPAATDDDLRPAVGDLPLWVTDLYLQLPDDLPQRVKDRAVAIVAEDGAVSPYDKAVAIQGALREYPYSLQLPAPPEDQDVVDAFLFDIQKGYCDYYASAFVVMARSVGVPARLATGYRTGKFDTEINAYQVSLADAHSWPEVYFVGYGWIPFEPTAAYPSLSHGLPAGWDQFLPPERAPAVPNWVMNDTPEQPRDVGSQVLIPVGAALGLMVLIAGIMLARDAIHEARRRKLPPDQLVASIYGDLARQAAKLGVRVDASNTPYEWLPALVDVLDTTIDTSPSWLARRLAGLPEQVRVIVDTYVDGIYSPRRAGEESAGRTLAAWGGVRWGMRMVRVVRALGLTPGLRPTPLPRTASGKG